MLTKKFMISLSALTLAAAMSPAIASTADAAPASSMSSSTSVTATRENNMTRMSPNPGRCYTRWSAMGIKLLSTGNYYLKRNLDSATYVCEICIPAGGTWACQNSRDPESAIEEVGRDE